MGASFSHDAPVEGDRWCLGALLDRSGVPEQDPREALLTRCLDDPAAAGALSDVGEILSRGSVFPVRSGLRTCAAPGLLLAGDAAGSVDLFSGQGIALALLTGSAAAAAAETMLRSGGDDQAARDRYTSFVRLQVGSRLTTCAHLRHLVDHPRWAMPFLRRLGSRPGAADLLVRLTRSPAPRPNLALPRILVRLLLP